MISEIYKSHNVGLILNNRNNNNELDLITFEHVRPSYSFPPQVPFGSKMAHHLDLNVLHVLPQGADWYQYDDREDWLSIIKGFCSGSTLAFGSSMGGYAVARYSDQLGLKRGLCFSPQYSIQRTVVPAEKRWVEHANRIDFSLEANSARDNLLWVFYDPYSDDRHHAHLIAETGRTVLIEVPYAGHPVGDSLQECGALHKIQEMFIRGEENRWDIYDLISTIPERSGTYYLNYSKNKPLKEKIMLWKKGLEISPSHVALRQHYGLFLLRNNNIEESNLLLKSIISYPRVRRLYKLTCEKYNRSPDLLEGREAI